MTLYGRYSYVWEDSKLHVCNTCTLSYRLATGFITLLEYKLPMTRLGLSTLLALEGGVVKDLLPAEGGVIMDIVGVVVTG